MVRLPFPVMAWIEPSAVCNLECPHCPTAAGRGEGVMSAEVFGDILNRLPPTVRILNLWHRGEPLVAPQFPEMVREASRRHLWTQTVTNGTLLKRGDRARQLVEGGLDRISVAVDGNRPETYAQYRRGARLEEVWEGIEALLQARRRKGRKKPQVIVEVLLRKMDPNEWKEIYRGGKQLGVDEVKFKTYRIPDVTDLTGAVQSLPDNSHLWRYELGDSRLQLKGSLKGCQRVGYSLVVAYNGEVMPCCFWVHPFGLGNIIEEGWKALWNGPLRRFAQKVNTPGAREKIPMCSNCTEGVKALYIPSRIVLNPVKRGDDAAVPPHISLLPRSVNNKAEAFQNP